MALDATSVAECADEGLQIDGIFAEY